jgi:hypothetical protein
MIGSSPGGYAVPLPPARYRITLWTVPWAFTRGASDPTPPPPPEASVEGAGVDRGRWKADARAPGAAKAAVDVEVRDGALDVRSSSSSSSRITAIEIEKLAS